ncbi:MAG: hypothetical protein RID53_26040 [Coleofasciculus sp. B1-GNL1-01]|uniref:hypothetical protein n=1 Tax=Coleofasciculus sp. B1-GNL1-01 TaxID=3068484 RepID=UPI003303F91B
MSHPVKVLDPNSIEAYRTRVQCLAGELKAAKNQVARVNIALMLADAATTLARLEHDEWQNPNS